MSTRREPTYKDLVKFIDQFVGIGFDVRVFRPRHESTPPPVDSENHQINRKTNMFYIGDWPVEKKYSKELTLTREFITGEIHKIKSQKIFDKTVKPYPHRDMYYQILINDFDDLCKLRDYWVEKHNPVMYKSSANASAHAKGCGDGGGGGGGGGGGTLWHDNLGEDEFLATPDHVPITYQIANAVIKNKYELASTLAKESGISKYSDALEGRVLQGDWGMARRLARQRLDDPSCFNFHFME